MSDWIVSNMYNLGYGAMAIGVLIFIFMPRDPVFQERTDDEEHECDEESPMRGAH